VHTDGSNAIRFELEVASPDAANEILFSAEVVPTEAAKRDL
jgi:hypothetical protein